jgi:hypothetical protein
MDSSRSSSNPDSRVYQLKGEARDLRIEAKARGQDLTHSAALDAVARRYGFKDWNAAAASEVPAGATLPVSLGTRYAFEDVSAPLPKLPLRFVQSGDRNNQNIHDLYQWARQLEFIADKVDAAVRREAMLLLGAKQPYVFAQNAVRWPDRLYHLCDRSYSAIRGVAFSRDELEAIGVVAWEAQCGMHGGDDMFSVVHDGVMTSSDAVLLKRAARVVASVALAVDAKVFGNLPGSDNAAH